MANVCDLHDTMKDADKSQCGKIESAFTEVRKRLHTWIFIPTVMLLVGFTGTVWYEGKQDRESLSKHVMENHDKVLENSIIIKNEFHHLNQQMASVRTRVDALATKISESEIKEYRKKHGDVYYQGNE